MEEREEKRGSTRSVNQSHAVPDNRATTILHCCDHLSFLLHRSSSFSFAQPRPASSLCPRVPLCNPLRRTGDAIVPLSIYILSPSSFHPLSRSFVRLGRPPFSSSRHLCLPPPPPSACRPPPPSHPPPQTRLARASTNRRSTGRFCI